MSWLLLLGASAAVLGLAGRYLVRARPRRGTAWVSEAQPPSDSPP